eukprot:6484158-Ditylum_brightwellii.AAC.1
MIAPTNPAHTTQSNAEYKDQLVWNDDLQEPIEDAKGDNAMEQTNKTGEKRKTEEKREKHSKQRKNKVELNTQKEETTKEIKEQIRGQGETAIDTEQGSQMEIQLEWPMQCKCTTFNLCTAFVNLINKMVTVYSSIYMKSEVTKE